MKIIAHTMRYMGGVLLNPGWDLRNYADTDYLAYAAAYNDCFSDMRRALGLTPIYCCDNRETLLSKAEDIFVLKVKGELAGSVAIYGSEIDDLFVAKNHQRKGYVQGLLRFAVARMQQGGVCPITLHVADWNRNAVRLYQKNGFQVIHTEVVR